MEERKQNGHSSLIWAPIKMNEYLLERKFYKVFNRTIFWYMFCYVHRGKATKKEAAAHNENKIVEMRTTTAKRSLGNASIGPREMKFRSLEQKKTPRALEKEGTSWQHPTLGDVRSKSPWITHK
jgi:hypothetical protein